VIEFKFGGIAVKQEMRVGITGAGGILGSALVQGFREKCELVLFDLKALPSFKQYECRQLDLADPSQLPGAFKGLDAIFHLAGNPSPGAPHSDTMRNNFLATSLVFEQARRDGVNKIVFASSNFFHQNDIAAALRSGRKSNIRLDDRASPDCLYGDSKVYGENLGRHYSCLGIDFVGLRIGWSVPGDTPVPYNSPYMRAMFCSKRDLVKAFEKSLESKEKFTTAFAISNNDEKVFDLTETQSKFGFYPEDNSARFF